MKTITDQVTVEIINSVIKSLMMAGKVTHADVANNADIRYGLADIGVAIASTIEVMNKRTLVKDSGVDIKFVEKKGTKFGVIQGGR